MNPPAIERTQSTRLLSRTDGIMGACMVCTRGTHYGARIETVRETTGRRVTLFACYDCIEVCHLIVFGRLPCDKCHGDGCAR